MNVLTPHVYAPAGLFQIGDSGGRDSELVDVAAGSSPSLQQVLGPVAGSIARLSPVGDEFSWYLERIAIIQTYVLAAERATLTLIGRFAATSSTA